jgi:iron complex outermembrane receptor protein
MRRGLRAGTVIALLLMCTSLGADEPAALDTEVHIAISASTIAAALVQFSQQTGLQILFATDGAMHLTAPRLTGTMTQRAALEYLLRDSGLTYEVVNSRTIAVRRNLVELSIARE